MHLVGVTNIEMLVNLINPSIIKQSTYRAIRIVFSIEYS